MKLLCFDGFPVVWTGDLWPVGCRESESADDHEWEDMDDEEGSGDDCSSAGLRSDGGDRSAPGSPQEAFRNHLFWEEETKSRFTEYSMTSSVMRRNEQLTLHDERFEKVRAWKMSLSSVFPAKREIRTRVNLSGLETTCCIKIDWSCTLVGILGRAL